MTLDITNAIRSLCPNAEFSLWDEDYSTIIWHVLDGNAPSAKEVNDEAKRLAESAINDKAVKLAKKAELLAKLGITEDEARLLLS